MRSSSVRLACCLVTSALAVACALPQTRNLIGVGNPPVAAGGLPLVAGAPSGTPSLQLVVRPGLAPAGADTPATAAGHPGPITIIVRWPARSVQAIPAGSVKLAFEVDGTDGSFIDATSVSYDPTKTISTATLPSSGSQVKWLPVGLLNFYARAYKKDSAGNDVLLGTASSSVQTVSNRDTQVTLSNFVTGTPSGSPSPGLTASPTAAPTASPTAAPTASPTAAPTATPTARPTATPTARPTASPTATPANPTPTPAPLLNAIDPTNGGPGQTIVISGSGFGNDPSLLHVEIDGADATVDQLKTTATTIYAKVPSGCGNGNVAVSLHNSPLSNGIAFTYIDQLKIATSSIELQVGAVVNVGWEALDSASPPVDVPSPTAAWISVGPSIATVAPVNVRSESVTGQTPGDTTVTLSAGDLSESVAVHVFKINNVTLDKTTLTLNANPGVGAGSPEAAFVTQANVTATVGASDSDSHPDRGVTWSWDPNYLLVTKTSKLLDGTPAPPNTVLVTTLPGATAADSLSLTATSLDNAHISAKCTVKVTDYGSLNLGVY